MHRASTSNAQPWSGGEALWDCSSTLRGGHRAFSTYIQFGLGILTWITAFVFLMLFSMYTLRSLKISHLLQATLKPSIAQYQPVQSMHRTQMMRQHRQPCPLLLRGWHRQVVTSTGTRHHLRVHTHTHGSPGRGPSPSILSSFSRKKAGFRVLALDWSRGTSTPIATETALLSLPVWTAILSVLLPGVGHLSITHTVKGVLLLLQII